jgi:hypothetical protein
MEVSAINEEDEEISFDLNICCEICSNNSFGWSVAQHIKVVETASAGTALKIPSFITDETKFIEYIRSL